MKLCKRKNILCTLILLVLVLASCNTAKLGDARMQYLRGEYYAASETYRQYYRNIKPQERALRGVVAYEMAEAYRRLNYTARASSAYANAIRYNYPDTTMYLRYAQMLHKEGKYQLAKTAYEDYAILDTTNYISLNGIRGVDLAMLLQNKPTRYIVKRMDLFNSNRSEFSPMLAQNDNVLYITSSRNDSRGDSISDITGLKNNDIFIVNKNDKGEWKIPEILNSEINTKFDEGVISITADGEYCYYTFSPVRYDEPSSTKIYYSRRSGSGGWNAGQELVISRRDSLSLFAHPSISADGNWLYFVSDMSGGYGGKDIWRAYVNNNSVLSVENVGADINTPADEMFPYIKNDSTLYFSSDGHPSIGGLDIFEAKLNTVSKRWTVSNMGLPINSSMDDFGITFEMDRYKGFFSSNRNDARGRDHIYSFELPDIMRVVKGFAIDREDEFISNARIDVVGNDGSQRDYLTKKDGTYQFEAKAGVNYLFMASAEGYLNMKKSLYVSPIEKDTTYFVDFEMSSYTKPVVLENIFYDFDRATLRIESKEELDGLIQLLNDNPNIAIELSAHTDRKGSDEYNNNLSLRRAQSVVSYLSSNGIDMKRLSAVGHGKAIPKIVSKSIADRYDFLNEGDALSEELIGALEEHQQVISDQINRRTEFRVIDHHFGLY